MACTRILRCYAPQRGLQGLQAITTRITKHIAEVLGTGAESPLEADRHLSRERAFQCQGRKRPA